MGAPNLLLAPVAIPRYAPASSSDLKIFFFVLSLRFSAGDVTSGGLSHFRPSLTGPGRQKTFLAQFVLETRLKSAFLEPLIGFLA